MPNAPSRHTAGFAIDGAAPRSIEPGNGARHVPRIALAGEANCGKTTLVNLLLQAQVLATDVIANTPCPTLLRFGDTEHLRVRRADGAVALRSLADLHRIGREKVQFIEVFLPLAILRSVEIVDLPGFASLADAKANRQWITAADVQIWCTAATQAWRASEQAKWQSLACPPSSALLVLTCRDLLSEQQLADVGERISRETKGFFSHWTAIAAPSAVAARSSRDAAMKTDLWQSAGINDLFKKLSSMLQETIASRNTLAPQEAITTREMIAPQKAIALQKAISTRREVITPAHVRSQSAEITRPPYVDRQARHPISSFKQVSARVLAALDHTTTAQQIAAMMAQEFDTYVSLVLIPWLRSNGRPAWPMWPETLVPRTEDEILQYLAPATSEPASFVARAILKQVGAELADCIILK